MTDAYYWQFWHGILCQTLSLTAFVSLLVPLLLKIGLLYWVSHFMKTTQLVSLLKIYENILGFKSCASPPGFGLSPVEPTQ